MNEHWKSPLGQLVLPVLVLIASICTGTLALGLWRSFDVVMARDARMLAEQQKFHTESVAAIQRLAENAGIMTSADLCPVRFRLRDENGLGIPRKSPYVTLRAITASGVELEPQVWMNTSGNLEFGLKPPGAYRLSLMMRDGMTLEHDFDVLPGVPVDRVVHTPSPAVGGVTKTELTIDWPKCLAEVSVIVVCRIEPAPAVLGEWRWQANPDWQPVYAVVTNGVPHPEDIDRLTVQMAANVCPADHVLVPYQYMHLTEITFLSWPRDSEAAGDELIDLGTVRFRIANRDSTDPVEATTSWTTDAPPPCFERYRVHWHLTLPADVVGELQARLDRRSAEHIAVSAATISGVLRLGDHSSDSH